jgi:NSS family neurotransmitter:Na+ symporter
VALLAGLAIFPIVFANGLEPGAGPGLIFKTLPIAFGHMEAGTMIGTAFFILLAFAAWTSAISLIEPAVAWLVENQGMNRIYAAVWIGIITWLLGIGSVLSFNLWSDYTWSVPFLFKDKNFFDTLDFVTANLMLPLGGLFIAIFAAWVMSENSTRDELNTYNIVYKTWHFMVKYITPIAVIIVFLNVIGVISL